MQLALDNLFQNAPISPAYEMGAYEALWLEEGASFKTIAEKFRGVSNALPSQFVDHDQIEHAKAEAYKLIDKAGLENFGVRLHGMADYIPKLRDAKHPIELFYYQGNWDLASSPSVAVVGTRKPSDDGRRRTRKLVKMLVEDNYTIASGLAEGIDTEAHMTALEHNGRTIAIIGTPLTQFYPKANKLLQQYLSQNFLVISQVPFVRYSKQSPVQNKWFFPERNKLMSAISQATIIVEAGETSGTLVQARAALEQGRKLFILESCFQNKNITWPSKYEQRGAIRVKEYNDIRRHLKK